MLRYVIAALGAVQGGYMLVDGVRALRIGSYITPSSGEHAGQLGPWASLVRRLGVSPDALGVKLMFVALGLAWLVGAAGATAAAPWAWTLVLVVAVASLWYAIPGTVISVVVLALLWVPSVRDAF